MDPRKGETMKIENLTFLEAVKALSEGKCEGIQPENLTDDYYIESTFGSIEYWFKRRGVILDDQDHRMTITEIFSTWKLINPKKEKKVIVRTWKEVYDDIRGDSIPWEAKVTIEYEE